MTEPDYAHTTGAERARLAKAAYLMDAAFAAGLGADDIAHLDDDARRALVKTAGTRPASAETWRLVATLMAREAPHRARPAAAEPRGMDVFG